MSFKSQEKGIPAWIDSERIQKGWNFLKHFWIFEGFWSDFTTKSAWTLMTRNRSSTRPSSPVTLITRSSGLSGLPAIWLQYMNDMAKQEPMAERNISTGDGAESSPFFRSSIKIGSKFRIYDNIFIRSFHWSSISTISPSALIQITRIQIKPFFLIDNHFLLSK